MKNEEVKKLKEEFNKLKIKRDEVIAISKEIEELEKNEIVKRYLELQKKLDEKTTGINSGYDSFTDEELISTVLENIHITPDSDVYVYLGSYKYNGESSSSDDADYALYHNLEAKYDEILGIPNNKRAEFENSHKIIMPNNILNSKTYFYNLQIEYFKFIVLESLEMANDKINKLIKK